MIEGKFRIKYKNIKLDKIFDIRCIDKVYETIRKMEKQGKAVIFIDERKEILSKLLPSAK